MDLSGNEFGELEPDDLIDERGRATAGEEAEREQAEPAGCRRPLGVAGATHRYFPDLPPAKDRPFNVNQAVRSFYLFTRPYVGAALRMGRQAD
jgi:hypothetical protein